MLRKTKQCRWAPEVSEGSKDLWEMIYVEMCSILTMNLATFAHALTSWVRQNSTSIIVKYISIIKEDYCILLWGQDSTHWRPQCGNVNSSERRKSELSMPLKEFLLKKQSSREMLPQVQPARHTKYRYIISCQYNLVSHLHDVNSKDMQKYKHCGTMEVPESCWGKAMLGTL